MVTKVILQVPDAYTANGNITEHGYLAIAAAFADLGIELLELLPAKPAL